MKYVITGSLGHISRPLAQTLIQNGHQVTIISSNTDRSAQITALGATPAIGSVEDVAFLTATFTGADVVYTMVPPTWAATNWKQHIHNIGRNYVQAIAAAGVQKVVNLSSIGAHMPDGCGPVSGLYWVESELNALEGVAVKHLRPGFFYYNMLANIGMIKNMGIIGGNYGENATLVMAHTNDIAAVAAEEMLNPTFTGKSVRYIASDEVATQDIARTLGAAIGLPNLPWVNFTDADTIGGMVAAGLSHEVASNYAEMGSAMANGQMAADYLTNKPQLSATKFTQFAQEFAAIYNAG